MRRKNVYFAPSRRWSWRLLACLLLAVLWRRCVLQRRATDEPFSGSSVMASPRDLHVDHRAGPAERCARPDAEPRRRSMPTAMPLPATPISNFVLDGAGVHLNASGLRDLAGAARPA